MQRYPTPELNSDSDSNEEKKPNSENLDKFFENCKKIINLSYFKDDDEETKTFVKSQNANTYRLAPNKKLDSKTKFQFGNYLFVCKINKDDKNHGEKGYNKQDYIGIISFCFDSAGNPMINDSDSIIPIQSKKTKISKKINQKLHEKFERFLSLNFEVDKSSSSSLQLSFPISQLSLMSSDPKFSLLLSQFSSINLKLPFLPSNIFNKNVKSTKEISLSEISAAKKLACQKFEETSKITEELSLSDALENIKKDLRNSYIMIPQEVNIEKKSMIRTTYTGKYIFIYKNSEGTITSYHLSIDDNGQLINKSVYNEANYLLEISGKKYAKFDDFFDEIKNKTQSPTSSTTPQKIYSKEEEKTEQDTNPVISKATMFSIPVNYKIKEHSYYITQIYKVSEEAALKKFNENEPWHDKTSCLIVPDNSSNNINNYILYANTEKGEKFFKFSSTFDEKSKKWSYNVIDEQPGKEVKASDISVFLINLQNKYEFKLKNREVKNADLFDTVEGGQAVWKSW